jgi:hypothetical protein
MRLSGFGQRDEGYVNAWWNGEQVVRYRGGVGYNDDAGPYVKFGLYRAGPKKPTFLILAK